MKQAKQTSGPVAVAQQAAAHAGQATARADSPRQLAQARQVGQLKADADKKAKPKPAGPAKKPAKG